MIGTTRGRPTEWQLRRPAPCRDRDYWFAMQVPEPLITPPLQAPSGAVGLAQAESAAVASARTSMEIRRRDIGYLVAAWQGEQ